MVEQTTGLCEPGQPHLMSPDIVPKMCHIDVLNQEGEIYQLLEVHRKHFPCLSKDIKVFIQTSASHTNYMVIIIFQQP